MSLIDVIRLFREVSDERESGELDDADVDQRKPPTYVEVSLSQLN